MASSYSCPVCGYDPGRDAGKYPSLARIRAEKVPFGGGHAPDPEEIARLKARIAQLEALLEEKYSASPRPVPEDPLWTNGGISGSIRPRGNVNLPAEVSVPAFLKGNPVTKLAVSAFRGKPVRRVFLPEGLTEIGGECFADCRKLEEVYLPSTLREIQWSAFSGCERLNHLILPEGLLRIGADCFCRAGLKEILVPSTVREIGDGAFSDCDELKAVRLPQGLEKTGIRLFSNCGSLESVQLPDGLAVIEAYMFENCEMLREIRLPASLRSIGDHAFSGCSSLRELELPNGVEKIHREAFAGCRELSRLVLPAAMYGKPLPRLRQTYGVVYRTE